MTEVFIATLVYPTETSELYEFTIGELTALYPSKAFASEEAAMAWAEAKVKEMEDEEAEYDEQALKYEHQQEGHSETGEYNTPTKWKMWSQGPEFLPFNSFCVHIQKQTF